MYTAISTASTFSAADVCITTGRPGLVHNLRWRGLDLPHFPPWP